MTFRASIAAAVLGTLALLGSFALPTQVENHHAHAPTSPVCMLLCLDAVKDEGVAIVASIAVVVALVGLVGMALGRFTVLYAHVTRPLVPVPLRSSDIRITRKRLD